MYKNILIATDGSDLSNKAVKCGLKLAQDLGARTTLVTVTEPWLVLDIAAEAESGIDNPIKDYEARAAKSASKILNAAGELAKRMGIACEQIHVKDHHPAKGIIETANKHEADWIVLASHGRRGLNRVLLGSVAMEVLTLSGIPVLISK